MSEKQHGRTPQEPLDETQALVLAFGIGAGFFFSFGLAAERVFLPNSPFAESFSWAPLFFYILAGCMLFGLVTVYAVALSHWVKNDR